MSVSNGQNLDETTFNNAFVSKTADSSIASEVELADADAVSGSTVTNVQRELNSLNSFLGKVLNTAKDLLPTWATNNVGSSSDDVKTRVEALDANVSTTNAAIALKADGPTEADDAATGANATLSAVATTVVRLTNASLTSIDMIPAGSAGQQFILVNRTTVSVTLNDDTGATAADRILTGIGSGLALANDSAVILEYDSTTTRWQVVGGSGGGGGGADQDLGNLTSPTAINQQLDFTGTNSIRVPNDTYYLGAFGGGSRTLIKVDAAGRIKAGQTGVDFRFDSDIEPSADGTYECGSSALRWLNVSADQLEGAGGMSFAAKTLPSGATAVSAIEGNNGVDVGMFTASNADADAAKTQCVFFETGNKSNAGSSGATGDVSIKTGDAAGSGNSGPIILETGTSASGTRGFLAIKEKSFPTASVNDVLTLQSAVTGEVAWATSPSAGPKNVSSYSSTSTISGTDDVAILSGASFTLTLTTAVSNAGKVFEIVHQGTSLSQVYTIDGNAAETIRGNTTFLLHTNGQRVRMVSDGSNWVVLDNYTETPWIDVGNLTISATTTGPTKGSTQATDNFFYKRSGDTAHCRMNFIQTDATGSNAGSGDYLFDVTAVGSIDTAKLDVYATVEGWNSSFVNAMSVGTGGHGGTFGPTTMAVGTAVVPYDASYVRLFSGVINSTGGTVGSAGYPLTGTNVWYTLDFKIPIDGWEH